MSHPEITHILDPDDSDAAVVGQVLGARGDVNYDESGLKIDNVALAVAPVVAANGGTGGAPAATGEEPGE